MCYHLGEVRGAGAAFLVGSLVFEVVADERGTCEWGLVLVSQLCAFYYIGAVELISNKDLLKKKEISKKDPLVKRWKKEILKSD